MSFPNAAELARNLTTYFIRNDDIINRWGNVISSYQNLPGLVGFWPMSSVQRSTGNAYDLSGQNRTLTYNGNPTYNIHNNIVPYIDLDGAGDFLRRADEVDLRITGTETIYNSSVRGMSINCWLQIRGAVDPVNFRFALSKWGAGQLAYFLDRTVNTNDLRFGINDGIASYTTPQYTVPVNTWLNVGCRFIPSTSVDLFINGVLVAQNTTAIPATINASTASFDIGQSAFGLASYNGYITLVALAANSWDSSIFNSTFQQSRVLFGV